MKIEIGNIPLSAFFRLLKMLQIDTKYFLLLVIIFPCWWLFTFREAEVINWTWGLVNMNTKQVMKSNRGGGYVEAWNLYFRRDLTRGFPCQPASTRSHQRTSRTSAYLVKTKMKLMIEENDEHRIVTRLEYLLTHNTWTKDKYDKCIGCGHHNVVKTKLRIQKIVRMEVVVKLVRGQIVK